MNSYYIYSNMTLPSHEDEVNIHVVVQVIGASKTNEQISYKPPGTPVELFTIMVSNVLECAVVDTLTKASTLSPFSVENIYSKGVGGRPLVAVMNLRFPQESSICNFSCCSPENPDSLYQNLVCTLQQPKTTITENIDF